MSNVGTTEAIVSLLQAVIEHLSEREDEVLRGSGQQLGAKETAFLKQLIDKAIPDAKCGTSPEITELCAESDDRIQPE